MSKRRKERIRKELSELRKIKTFKNRALKRKKGGIYVNKSGKNASRKKSSIKTGEVRPQGDGLINGQVGEVDKSSAISEETAS